MGKKGEEGLNGENLWHN